MTSVTGQIKGEKPTVPGAPAVVRQQDIFILAGNSGKETFQPLFTYRGFRYIEIAGYNGTLATTDITGLRMQSDIQPAGSFECSDPLINRIQEATLNSFRSNIFSVQSDCPHREKFGYGADMLTTAEAYIYNFDMYAFYAKALQDYEDAARLEGGLTETAPFVGIADAGLGDGSGPIGWGTFLPAGMDKHYRYYGNKEMIRQHYPTAKRWVEFLKSKAVNNIIDVGLSDHESIAEKPVRLTSTLFYYYNVTLLARFAHILELEKDIHRYGQLAQEIKQTIQDEFLRKGTGQFDNHNQIAQSFALYFDVVPEEEISLALDRLINDIEVIHKGHLSTGMFASVYMPLMLSQYGYGEKAFEVVTKKGFPGWSYMFEQGATSLWEHWGYSDNTFSYNHPMFGCISEWFYKCIRGIRPALDTVGFDKIVVRPDYIGQLKWANTSYQSVHGKISTAWKHDKKTFELTVTIPDGCSAEVYVPVSKSKKDKRKWQRESTGSNCYYPE